MTGNDTKDENKRKRQENRQTQRAAALRANLTRRKTPGAPAHPEKQEEND